MHLLNSKLRTLEKRITILYDDQNLLGVDELVSLGRLVCVGGVHSAVDLLHLEQDGHGYTSPLLGRGVDHLHVPDTVFTDHDTAGSSVFLTYFVLADLATDCPNLRTFLGNVYRCDLGTDSLVHVFFKFQPGILRCQNTDDILCRYKCNGL